MRRMSLIQKMGKRSRTVHPMVDITSQATLDRPPAQASEDALLAEANSLLGIQVDIRLLEIALHYMTEARRRASQRKRERVSHAAK